MKTEGKTKVEDCIYLRHSDGKYEVRIKGIGLKVMPTLEMAKALRDEMAYENSEKEK